MKTTAVIRFDGTSFLHWGDKLLTFPSYDELKEYADKNGIRIEIYHSHPAGIKMEERDGNS